MAAVEAHCVKCREKREIKDPKEVTTKNDRPAMEGTCPVCGTKLFRVLSGATSGGDGAEKMTATADGESGKAKAKTVAAP
jgi:hypothetical protein